MLVPNQQSVSDKAPSSSWRQRQSFSFHLRFSYLSIHRLSFHGEIIVEALGPREPVTSHCLLRYYYVTSDSSVE